GPGVAAVGTAVARADGLLGCLAPVDQRSHDSRGRDSGETRHPRIARTVDSRYTILVVPWDGARRLDVHCRFTLESIEHPHLMASSRGARRNDDHRVKRRDSMWPALLVGLTVTLNAIGARAQTT